MSAARLPGRILWCVHMGNFSPVDRDEFKKHDQKFHKSFSSNIKTYLSLKNYEIQVFLNCKGSGSSG